MNRESKAVKRYAELRDTKNMTESIDVLVEELARERAIGAIKFTRNLEYMDGTKPQHEFTDEEIYSKYEEQKK